MILITGLHFHTYETFLLKFICMSLCMFPRRKGLVINMSSEAGFQPQPMVTLYSCTKVRVHKLRHTHYTRCVCLLYYSTKVRVHQTQTHSFHMLCLPVAVSSVLSLMSTNITCLRSYFVFKISWVLETH